MWLFIKEYVIQIYRFAFSNIKTLSGLDLTC